MIQLTYKRKLLLELLRTSRAHHHLKRRVHQTEGRTRDILERAALDIEQHLRELQAEYNKLPLEQT